MDSIDRYILRQLIVVQIAVSSVLTGAVWMSQSLRLISLIVNDGLSFGTFLYLTSLLVPSLQLVTLPIATTVATIMVYNRLASDSELTVMRAAGRGPLRLAYPGIVSGVLATFFGLFLSLYVLPNTFREYRSQQQEISRDAAVLLIQEGQFTGLAPGLTVFVRSRNPDGEMRGVFIHDSRDTANIVTIFADRGLIAIADNQPRIVLIDGTRQQFERATNRVSVLQFARNVMEIPRRAGGGLLDGYLTAQERYLDELLWPEPDPRHRDMLPFYAEATQRVAGPLFGLVGAMIVLAAILSGEYNRRGRTGRIAAGGTAFALLMVLYLAAINLSARVVEALWLPWILMLIGAAGATIQIYRHQPWFARRRPALG